MSWVRIDDQAPTNRKLLRAGPAACWLWVCGLAYCQRHLTDGFIPDEVIPLLGVRSHYMRLTSGLVVAELWLREEGGYRIKDYLEYNQSRNQVIAKRADDLRRKSKIPRGIHAESGRIPNDPTRAPANPSHPIYKKNTLSNAREAREGPIFQGQRFVVWQSQHDKFTRILGTDADAFALTDWYFKLDQKWAAKGAADTVSKDWLEQQLRIEARNRGLLLGSQQDMDRRANGNGHRPTPPNVKGRTSCQHDPPCANTRECTKRTINDNRKNSGREALA